MADTHWKDLSAEHQEKLLDIMSDEGFTQLKGDEIHFSVDPKKHGYSSTGAAINENREDFDAWKESGTNITPKPSE